jgi:hypothetical protein
MHNLKMRALFLTIFLVLAGVAVALRSQEPPAVPEEIAAPAGERAVLRVHAKGDQIYVCQQGVTASAWRLKEPDALLLDKDGKVVGKHFAGPSWQMSDGSRVKGDPDAKVDSPERNAIPWLRVKVIDREGSGVLAPVTTIQRINTKGGAAPLSGCAEAHGGKELRVPYEADYVFYVPK